jgi:hypothetical protein
MWLRGAFFIHLRVNDERSHRVNALSFSGFGRMLLESFGFPKVEGTQTR